VATARAAVTPDTLLVSAAAPAVTPFKSRTNLPDTLQPIIGRQALLTNITAALHTGDARLVTLTGLGGVGKSTLAVHAGRALLDQFADGVWRIVPGAESLQDKLADFGRRQFGMEIDSLNELLSHFSRKQLLLILDDCDEIHQQTPWLETLLNRSPHLAILATTRQRLLLPSERSFWLDGLPVPSPEQLDLTAYRQGRAEDSVQLFIQAAQRTHPSFQVRQADLPEIAAICREVGGLPLALLLAANWAGQLAPAQIRQGLEHDAGAILPLFARRAGGIQAVNSIFWVTWQHLHPQEQQALLRLTIFEQSFSMEAADVVASVALSVLIELVDQSLINHEEDDFYRWHPLVRRFVATLAAHGAEVTEAHPAAEEVQERYTTYFMNYVAVREQAFHGRTPQTTIDEVWRVWPDLQQAWRIAVERKQLTRLLTGMRGLAEFCLATDQTPLGAALMQQASDLLDQRQTIPANSAAGALAGVELSEEMGWAYLHWVRFSLQRAPQPDVKAAIDKMVALAQQSRAPGLLAEVYRYASHAPFLEKGRDESKRMLDVALHYAEDAGTRRTQALIYRQMAFAETGEIRNEYFERSIHLAHQCGDIASEIDQLSRLGAHLTVSGHYHRAHHYLQRAAQLCSTGEVGPTAQYLAMGNLAEFYFTYGNHAQALPLFQKIIDYFAKSNLPRRAIRTHLFVAETYLRQRRVFDALNAADKALAAALQHELANELIEVHSQRARSLTACGMGGQARQSYQQLLAGQELADAAPLLLPAWAGWIEFSLAHGDRNLALQLGEQLLTRLHAADEAILGRHGLYSWRVALETLHLAGDSRYADSLHQKMEQLEKIAKALDEPARRLFWEEIADHAQLAERYAGLTQRQPAPTGAIAATKEG